MSCAPSTPARLQMGFFAEAGPLQVFVSNHLIPESFEFNTAHEPCYQVRRRWLRCAVLCRAMCWAAGTPSAASVLCGVDALKLQLAA